MIRVLVAEDARAARALLVSILEADPAIQVVGQAANGEEAVEMARRLMPDVVTMDIQMPQLDGLQATQRIMAESPTRILVVSGTADPRDVAASLQATRAGALAVLPRPPGPGAPEHHQSAARLVSLVKALADVRVVRQFRRADGSETAAGTGLPRRAVPPAVIAVAASTGGPPALVRLLSDLPRQAPPVLVVQHIARGFVGPLADWLGSSVGRTVKLAEAGEELHHGTVYVAPEDQHLEVRADLRAQLHNAPLDRGFRPSANHLFASVGRAFGRGAVAVVLTGMGNDGTDGLRQAHAAGTFVIAQDEASSVVFGMPREVIAAGAASEVLPLAAIGPRIAALLRPR